MNVVGLDLSLTSTGICWATGATSRIRTKHTGVERLIKIRESIFSTFSTADLVAIEGYSYASKFSHAHALGELGGVIRVALHEARLPYVDIPPKCLKRYATGKGNASKDQVLAAGVHRSGVEFGGNDECDAWWLRAMALDHYREPVVKMPVAHRTGLDGVNWPARLCEIGDI